MKVVAVGLALALDWIGLGFGYACCSRCRSSRVIFRGLEFGKEDPCSDGEFKEIPKHTKELRVSQ
ncbi:hypothetical protein CRYUN_Cryun35bG0037200 [Craigia yunnanensis]